MENHEREVWETMVPNLQISQGDQAHLERSTDRLTSICRVKLPEDVMQVGLHRRRRQPGIPRQPFRSVTLRSAAKYFHFPRSQGNRTAVG